MDKYSKNIGYRIGYTLTISVLLAVMTACGGSDERTIGTTLPDGNILTLWCPEVGIADEKCILDDPENPFAKDGLDCSENGQAGKFALHRDTESIPKSNFYLWGTYLARCPVGENQYYTALALHKLYTQGSVLAKDQALKAYRSVLDNYLESVTFFEIPIGSGTTIPVRLKGLTAKELLGRTSTADSRKKLFNAEIEALQEIGVWGFTVTTTDSGADTEYTVTKNE